MAAEGLAVADEYDWRRVGLALEAAFRRAKRAHEGSESRVGRSPVAVGDLRAGRYGGELRS